MSDAYSLVVTLVIHVLLHVFAAIVGFSLYLANQTIALIINDL